MLPTQDTALEQLLIRLDPDVGEDEGSDQDPDATDSAPDDQKNISARQQEPHNTVGRRQPEWSGEVLARHGSNNMCNSDRTRVPSSQTSNGPRTICPAMPVQNYGQARVLEPNYDGRHSSPAPSNAPQSDGRQGPLRTLSSIGCPSTAPPDLEIYRSFDMGCGSNLQPSGNAADYTGLTYFDPAHTNIFEPADSIPPFFGRIHDGLAMDTNVGTNFML